MKRITLVIMAVVALAAVFYFYQKSMDPVSAKSVVIIGPDAAGIVWGTYTNSKYKFEMEYPYASTLSPFLIGQGQSAAFGTTTENSVLIGFGAPYNTKTVGLENAPTPIDPSMTGPVPRTEIGIEETPFFSSIDQWVSYRQYDPFPREVIEKEVTVAGEKAFITYHFGGEFEAQTPPVAPTVPENPVHSRTIGFLHNGKLYTIHIIDMKLEDAERIAKSFRFIE